MEHFDESWDEVAPEAELEVDSDPEALWRSLVADEDYPRYWSESVWSHDAEDVFRSGALLFVDSDAEVELCNEIRLSELWRLCEGGCLAMDEFFELSALIARVSGLPGSRCVEGGPIRQGAGGRCAPASLRRSRSSRRRREALRL